MGFSGSRSLAGRKEKGERRKETELFLFPLFSFLFSLPPFTFHLSPFTREQREQ